MGMRVEGRAFRAQISQTSGLEYYFAKVLTKMCLGWLGAPSSNFINQCRTLELDMLRSPLLYGPLELDRGPSDFKRSGGRGEDY